MFAFNKGLIFICHFSNVSEYSLHHLKVKGIFKALMGLFLVPFSLRPTVSTQPCSTPASPYIWPHLQSYKFWKALWTYRLHFLTSFTLNSTPVQFLLPKPPPQRSSIISSPMTPFLWRILECWPTDPFSACMTHPFSSPDTPFLTSAPEFPSTSLYMLDFSQFLVICPFLLPPYTQWLHSQMPQEWGR